MHDTAFCDEGLQFGTVMEEAMQSKTGPRANYYRSLLGDSGGFYGLHNEKNFQNME